MNAHWEALIREAEDPSVSAHRLAELALEDPSLWETILRNPSCDPAYREWILAQRPELSAVVPVAPVVPVPMPVPTGSTPPPSAAPTQTKRGPLLLLTALGALALVMILGAGGTLWWFSQDSEEGPPVAAGEESTPNRQELPPETDPVALLEGDDGINTEEETASITEDDAGETSPAADVSTAPETTAPIESATTVAGAPTIDGERIEGEETLVISSPSKNIGCELGESYVGCTIRERDLDAVGCSEHPTASFEIVDGSSAMAVCDAQYLGEVGDPVIVLEYGESISFGGTTCASKSDGMTCWDDETGHSMTVSRRGVWLS